MFGKWEDCCIIEVSCIQSCGKLDLFVIIERHFMKTHEMICHMCKINILSNVLTNMYISLLKPTTKRNTISTAFQQCVFEEDHIKIDLISAKVDWCLEVPYKNLTCLQILITLPLQLGIGQNYLQKKCNLKEFSNNV